MKKVLAAVAISAIAAVAAVPALAGTKSVKVGDDYFVRDGGRPTVAIKKGSTLKFVWRERLAEQIEWPGRRLE